MPAKAYIIANLQAANIFKQPGHFKGWAKKAFLIAYKKYGKHQYYYTQRGK